MKFWLTRPAHMLKKSGQQPNVKVIKLKICMQFGKYILHEPLGPFGEFVWERIRFRIHIRMCLLFPSSDSFFSRHLFIVATFTSDFPCFLDECMRATDLCAGVAPTTDHYKLKMSRVFTHWWPLLFESIMHRDTFHYVKGVRISYGQVLAVWELSAIGHRKQNICT